jgi:hypothetical protein
VSRVAELWSALTAAERDQVAAAMRTVLRDRGEQLVLAIAREARPVPVAERCHGCDLPADELVPLWDFTTSTLLMLDPGCWRERMVGRQRGEVPGDVQHPFPTPMPLTHQEAP